MNRHIWQRDFLENQTIKWPCPACHAAKLILEKRTLNTGETSQSLNEHREAGWEPGWIEGRFTCFLKCHECLEDVAVAGRYSVEEWGNDELRQVEHMHRFEPLFFMQAPPIIQLPKKLPLDIQKEIEASFQLYWVDLASCANRIRSSVEMLLTDLGVKRTIVSNRRRRDLNLHNRIEIFRDVNSMLADALLAVKWIGNAGSHSNALDEKDILDGYEMLEYVLEELFDQRSKRMANLARQINKAKKPRSAIRILRSR
ncbi:DUF4145 domain-containing protein [bacterium]|nr:MAG: DUF4145 domain-containing protein [bacterium]